MMAKWAHRMRLGDIWNESADDGSDWEMTRDATLVRMRGDGWCQQYLSMEHGPLDETHLGWLLSELEAADSLDEFNEVWDQIYDWADINRLWLQVF